jgi:hypothetical protein
MYLIKQLKWINSMIKFVPATDFVFWPFNRGMTWYHQKHVYINLLIHTVQYLNQFSTKIYENYFKKEINAEQCLYRQTCTQCGPKYLWLFFFNWRNINKENNFFIQNKLHWHKYRLLCGQTLSETCRKFLLLDLH